MTTLTEPLSIVDYATGVSGSYCIGKRNPTGFWSYWNPSGWAGSGYLFEDRKLAERVLQLLACIEAAKAMRELGVEISRRCIEPPYMSEKAAVNKFIGVFDGPLQRKLDAALAKLERERYPRPQCP